MMPRLSRHSGASSWLVRVAASCMASAVSRSRRTSLWMVPRALVLVLPSACVVRVPPRMALLMPCSQRVTSWPGMSWVVVVGVWKMTSMPAGMMPAASCPRQRRACSSALLSSAVEPGGYLPRRRGRPWIWV